MGRSGYDPAIEASTFIWMFIVLKVPIVAALLVIWWAIREPEPAAPEREDDGGGSKRERDPRPRGPRPPRRGPHAAPASTPPARVRTVARGRKPGRATR